MTVAAMISPPVCAIPANVASKSCTSLKKMANREYNVTYPKVLHKQLDRIKAAGSRKSFGMPPFAFLQNLLLETVDPVHHLDHHMHPPNHS